MPGKMWETMAAPLKTSVRPSATAAPQDPWKELAMVVGASIGVGMMAVILLLIVVLVLVALYVQVIWPLTDWDLMSTGLEPYSSLITLVLTTVFVAGFAAGYWYISGNAWKRLPRPAGVVPRTAIRARR